MSLLALTALAQTSQPTPSATQEQPLPEVGKVSYAEHVAPILQEKCESCHRPGQVGPFPLYNPRQQRWSDHFAWTPDYTQILGLTPTGRATVDALRLNRVGL